MDNEIIGNILVYIILTIVILWAVLPRDLD